jgi:hypothetical protein
VEVVHARIGVVNETDHENLQVKGSIGADKGGAVGFGCMGIEKAAGDKYPNDRTVGATLPRTVYGMQVAVGVLFVRDAELCLQDVFCLTKECGVNKTQSLVLTEAPGGETGDTWYDSVVAAGCIKVHTQEGTTAGPSCFPLELFEENWGHGISAREAAELSGVKEGVINAMMC